ncbi:MAG: hypothetical protein ACFFDW_14530 [Candidatus Thorarchaeota archaeon]
MENQIINSFREFVSELMKLERYDYIINSQLIKRYILNSKDIENERNNLSFWELERLIDFTKIDAEFNKKLLDALGCNFFKTWITNCDDIEQIDIILELIDYSYQEMSEEILNELSLSDLMNKIKNSDNMTGISNILREIIEISYSKGEELINKLSDEKVIQLIKQIDSLSNIDIFYPISLIDQQRVEKLVAFLHEDYFKAFKNAKNHNEIYNLIWTLELYSKSETKQLIEEFSLTNIEELVRKDLDIDSESLTGIIEVLGNVSPKLALDFVDLIEDIIIEIAKNARVTGDISDFLEVIGDISQKRAKDLLNKITIETIVNRMLEIETMQYIRSIAGLLKVLNEISKSDAQELVNKFGLEKIKKMIKNNWKNCHAAVQLIEAMNSISFELGEQAIAELDINFLKKLITCNINIDWYLKLVNNHSNEKAKEIVKDHERLKELFDYLELENIVDLFTVLIEIDKNNFREFLETLTIDNVREKIEYEIKDSKALDNNFHLKLEEDIKSKIAILANIIIDFSKEKTEVLIAYINNN